MPVAMTARPGSTDLYVAERIGTVRRVTPTSSGQLDVDPTPVIDVHTPDAPPEQGLLGVAFSPGGDTLFVSASDPSDNYSLVLASYRMKGRRADERTRVELIRVRQPFDDHQGGTVVFGPDGFLYWGLGDGGTAPDDPVGGFSNTNGQDLNVYQGKVLRIDPQHTSPGRNYAIPPDNPFARGGGLPEIWAYGLRNPWRFSFDRDTGDLWIGDVGWERFEEVDVLRRSSGGGRGANLGWRILEGSQPATVGDAPATTAAPLPPNLVGPIYEYPHPAPAGGGLGSAAVIGGVVYRGRKIPSLRGTYLFADFVGGGLQGLRPATATAPEHARIPTTGAAIRQPVAFAEDARGEVFILTNTGSVLRLTT
ncbi:MAG: PQQ-dependent sugar dehydrogenase [Actinomycetes bacterium]